MYVTEPRTVRKPRKEYCCYWCADPIDGQHVAWNCLERGQRSETVRCHEECNDAWQRGLAGKEWRYYLEEVSYGDHARGCLCQHGFCKCKGKDGGA